MKKLLFGFAIGVLILLGGGAAYAATTTESLDVYRQIEMVQAITGEAHTAPYTAGEAGNENINPYSGALSYQATDLILPGRNGFDVVFQRTYTNQMKDKGYYELTNSMATSVIKFAYQYSVTHTNGTTETCYVLFASEQEMYDEAFDSFLAKASGFSGARYANTVNGLNAYIYSSLKLPEDSTSTSVTMTRTARSQAAVEVDVKAGGINNYFDYNPGFSDERQKQSIGQGWRLSMPYLHFSGSRYISNFTTGEILAYVEDYAFCDESDQIVSMKMVQNKDSGGVFGPFDVQYSENTGYNVFPNLSADGMSLETRTKNSGTNKEFQYEFVVYRAEDGVFYYFDSAGRLTAKENRLRNQIVYKYQNNRLSQVVDTYDRVINLSWTNGELQSISYGNKTVTYQKSYANDAAKDPGNVLDCDNTYTLTVTRPEGEETKYLSAKKQISYNHGKSSAYDTCYYITEIQHPTGGKTQYTYEEEKVSSRKDVEGTNEYNRYSYEYEVNATTAERGVINQTIEELGYVDLDSGLPNQFTRVKSQRKADGGLYDSDYEYTYLYGYHGGRNTYILECYGTYFKRTRMSYSVAWGSYKQVTDQFYKEYLTTRSDPGLQKEVHYTYDDTGSVIEMTDGKTVEKNQYYRKPENMYAKNLIRRAVANGERRETVTTYDYTGHAQNKWNYAAPYAVYVWDDALDENGNIIGGTGIRKEETVYEYNDYGETAKVTRKLLDASGTQTGTDVTEYEYITPAGYGTDLTVTRSVKEKKTANAKVSDAGEIVAGDYTTEKTSVYDCYGNLVSVSGNGVDPKTYTYDAKGRVLTETSVVDNSQKSYQYTIHASGGARTRVTDEAGTVTDANYDGLGRYKSTVIYTGGGTSGALETEAVTYDELGRVYQKTVAKGAGVNEKYTLTTHYWCSNKVWREEIRSGASNRLYRQNLYSYEESYTDTGDHDANCEQITVKISDGVSERTARVYHDLWDLVHKEEVVETGADGVETVHKTTYEYDRYGILQSKKTPNDNAAGTSGASESYAYDYAGRVVSLTNAAGAEAETVYDSLGRVTEEYDFNGNVTGYGYNTYGLLSSVESGEAELLGQGVLPRTLYSYDENGNRALERSNFVNQNDGNTASVMQPRVHTKYDMRGRVDYVAVYEADCETKTYTKYFYDVKGNVKKVVSGLTSPSITETTIPAGASVVEYEYHPYLGVMTKMIQPDGTKQYFEYDYFGLLSEQGYVGENSETYGEISYSYSNIGELVSKTAGEEQNTYTYNLAGQVTSVSDATGTREYTYDQLGRVVQEEQGDYTKMYSYDSNGNRTKFVLRGLTGVIQEQRYVYDRQNRLTQIRDGADSVIAAYTYDANGNLLTETKGGEVVTSYTYNANNWLTGKTNKKTDNTLLSQYTYTHYRDGNIYQENAGFQKEDDTWQTQNRTYAYDPQGRLKQVTEGSSVTSYTYDLRGNRLTKATGTDTTSYTYDLNNRLLSEAEGDTTTLYEYDDRGNLVSKRKETLTDETVTTDSASVLTDNLSENVELYTYNGFNQLSEYRTGGTRASYTYNAEGIRTSKTVNGNTTQFLLNGANVIGEIGANNQVTHYIRGATGIIYSVDGSYAQSTKKYYTTNGHGDVVGLLNNAGVLTKSYTYDPFGVEQNIDPADTNPFRYCGEYFDNESKDLYLRARYYSAGIGRFTQQDPAMADGMNWYNYCGGNPINKIDPRGTMAGDTFDTIEEAENDAASYCIRRSSDPDDPLYGQEIVCEIYPVYQGYQLVGYTYQQVPNMANDPYQTFSITNNRPCVSRVHNHPYSDVDVLSGGLSDANNKVVKSVDSDIEGANKSGVPIVAVDANGDIYKYDPKTKQKTKREGAATPDPRYVVYQRIGEAPIMKLLKKKYPNASTMDILNARVKNPQSWLDVMEYLEELEKEEDDEED